MPLHPPLPRSFRNTYPFRLAAPSFIYPDHYAPNVEMLGPYLDEIELLFFESPEKSLPDGTEIDALRRLKETLDMTYNVHLPTDISLTDADPAVRKQALSGLRRVIRLTEPLSPTAFILHLPVQATDSGEKMTSWRNRAADGIEGVLSTGVPARKIAVETLEDPLTLAGPLVEDYGLSVCLDIGHGLLWGYDLPAVFDAWVHRISMIHLHGVIGRKDHAALRCLTDDTAATVIRMLRDYKGGVSIEVFSYNDLVSSLDYLFNAWQKESADDPCGG